MSLEIVPLPQLADNYAYLVFDRLSGRALVVDAAEAGVVLAAVSERQLKLEAVLSTHHHPDHVGGNLELSSAVPGLRIFGAAIDRARIPGLTDPVEDGGALQVIGQTAELRYVPCHTRGHATYRFGSALFTGDTLFVGGCGRFFEGSATDMYRALYEVIGSLPDETLIYCGHEYTEKNLDFALTLEPGNAALHAKRAEARALRRAGRPTVPSRLGEERAYNPFLRARSPELMASVAELAPETALSDAAAVLGAVRALKDRAGATPAEPRPAPSLYVRAGGAIGLRRVVESFYAAVFEDAMIGFFFASSSQARLVAREVELMSVALGAPDASYRGQDLAQVHARHQIFAGQFDRRQVLLRAALERHALPPEVADAWLAHAEGLRSLVVQGDCS